MSRKLKKTDKQTNNEEQTKTDNGKQTSRDNRKRQ